MSIRPKIERPKSADHVGWGRLLCLILYAGSLIVGMVLQQCQVVGNIQICRAYYIVLVIVAAYCKPLSVGYSYSILQAAYVVSA